MAFQKKRCQAFGVRYASRTLAIKELIKSGYRKCDIARKIGANYSFIVTVEKQLQLAK
jgi:hypothetical protein